MFPCCWVSLTAAGCPIVPMRGGPDQGQPARKIAPTDSSQVCMHMLHACKWMHTGPRRGNWLSFWRINVQRANWMFLFNLCGSETGVKHHNETDLLTLLVDQLKKNMNKHHVANGLQFSWILSGYPECWPTFKFPKHEFKWLHNKSNYLQCYENRQI